MISEYSGLDRPQSLGFSAKLSLGLWMLFPIVFPIYLFDPGGPQVSTAVVMITAVVAFTAGFRVPPRLRTDMRPLHWFLWYVCLVNIAWAALSENFRMLMPLLFYLFNFLAMLLCLMLYGRAGIGFLKLAQHAFAFSVLLQILLLFIGGPTTGRESIYFDNPNQLGYFALSAAAILLMLADRLETPTWYRGATMGICFFLVMVSTSFAAIGGFAVLMILALKRHPTMLVLMALAFAALLSVWDADLFLSQRIEYETEELEGTSFMASRGYDRILNHPEHIFLGAGEGNYSLYESAIGKHEIHSSYGTLVFSYGIVGTLIFIFILLSLVRGGRLRYAQYVFPVFLYGIAHQGLRSTMLWVFMALVYCVGDSQRFEPMRHVHASPASARRRTKLRYATPLALMGFLCGLGGCADKGLIEAVPIEQPAIPQAEVDVTAFGARGDDKLDDTNAFAAALRALALEGGVVRIPAGTYLFTATPRSGIGRGIDIFHRSNITFAGEGIEQSILRMAPGASYNGDTHVVLVELSTGITMRDLTIDGNRGQVSYRDEQSHGVEVRGSSNLRFERVLFTGMYGDGIRLLGMLRPTLSWVDKVSVVDCHFAYNGRSGIAVQRAVSDLMVTRSTFTQISDQSIDMEPSGASGSGSIGPRDFEITNNRFFDTAPLALTITGVASGDPARNILVADNEFDDTGIFVFNAVDVRIENNEIRSGRGWAPIEVRKRSERIWIVDNAIDARGTTGKAAIVLTFHTSAAPKDVHVLNNTILTAGSGGLFARDTEGLQVTGNRLSGAGNFGISIHDIVPNSPLDGFLVENNTISGYEVGIAFVSRGDGVTGVCVRNNEFSNMDIRVQHSGPVQFGC